ncbi:MAG: magnesium/cobalt transporter CorA [Bacteroidota bacterium]
MARLKIPQRKKKQATLSAKSGLPPESMVYVGKERTDKVTLEVINYNDKILEESTIEDVLLCEQYKQQETVTWISVTGIHEPAIIQQVCGIFNIHPLIQEDILNTQQRTKIEEFDEYIFVTFKNIFVPAGALEIETEQISLVIGHGFMLSFQETTSPLFEDIKYRIRTGKGPIRQRKSDYLLYKILDSAVDQYFVMIDRIGDKVEDMEEETMYYPNSKTTYKIQAIKKDTMLLNKHILPMREALNKLEGGNSDLIEVRNINYFRDVYDHTYQAYETIDNYRSLLTDLMNIYFTTMSNKLNQVMKVLTIISTIFMPLSFLTGVFGMNFEYLPGIKYHYGYHIFWSIVLVSLTGMLIYFKRKKWF